MKHATTVEKIHVWDRFIRFFHWGLVACIVVNFFVMDDGETLHRYLGYTANALICARIVWGFVGSRYARFADFFPTPLKIKQHLQNVKSGTHDEYPGHNPVAAMMMFALMALVLSLGVTGYMQGTDTYFGEEWVQELHETLASTLIAFSGLHAAAAIVMSRIERTNLVRAMVTGVKVRPVDRDLAETDTISPAAR
jgi:cytochrome b